MKSNMGIGLLERRLTRRGGAGKLSIAILVLVLTSIWGCSCDEDTGRPTLNVDIDTGPEVGQDASPIVEDTGEDADVTTDTAEDVADASEDVIADADGTDDADAPEPPCREEPECADGQAAIGGGCVDPTSEPLAADGELTYIRQITLADSSCCFDLTGDGQPDNRLATILESLAGVIDLSDPQVEIDSSVEVGEFNMLAEWVGLDDQLTADPLAVRFLFGSTDLDGDRMPDQDYDDRAAGNGVFVLLANSLGEYGPTLQYHGGTAQAGELASCPVDMTATTLIPNLTDDRRNDIPMTGVQLSASLTRDAEGLRTVDGEVPGAALGGALHGEWLVEVLNESAANCPDECGLPTGDLLSFAETDTEIVIACTTELPDPYPCADDRSAICANLPAVCQQAGALGLLADVDSNDNGVADAYSFAFHLSAVPATVVAEDPVAPIDEICGNDIDDDRDFRIECWDIECRDDLSCQ